MEKSENELLLEQILNSIEKIGKKNEEQNPIEALKQIVWEGLPFLKSNAGTMSNELKELYKTYKEYLKLNSDKKTNNIRT